MLLWSKPFLCLHLLCYLSNRHAHVYTHTYTHTHTHTRTLSWIWRNWRIRLRRKGKLIDFFCPLLSLETRETIHQIFFFLINSSKRQELKICHQKANYFFRLWVFCLTLYSFLLKKRKRRFWEMTDFQMKWDGQCVITQLLLLLDSTGFPRYSR